MFEGVFPPIPTPFVDGEVAHDKLSENIVKWNQTGPAGYVVLGSNGENIYLSEAEKRAVIVTAREAIPSNKLLIVGTGRESTKLTIESTWTAADLGADGVLIVTPSYYKGQMTSEALYRHYISVAEASPIPIVIYNVPKFTGLNIAATLVARLAEHPKIVGIKDSAGDIDQLVDIIRLAPQDFEVLVGNAPAYYSALGVGAMGAILRDQPIWHWRPKSSSGPPGLLWREPAFAALLSQPRRGRGDPLHPAPSRTAGLACRLTMLLMIRDLALKRLALSGLLWYYIYGF